MKLKIAACLFFILFTCMLFSQQQYRIVGKITDSQTKEAIVGAIVKNENTGKAVFTDFDGNFVISNLEQGTYTLEISYISYLSKKVPGVTAVDSSSKAEPIEIRLDPEGKLLKEVTVTETKKTNTETSVVMEMKKSNSIINAISAAQIAKTQDRDASDVIRRLPGVSVIDNKFIMVRGLADRYNNVWINDAAAPSSEVDKKSFSFDMVTSNLIDRLLVYKTASPELPGDFAGGMVKIYTTAMPSKTGLTVNYNESFRQNTTGREFFQTKTYKNDWLGMGSKDRALPSPKIVHSSISDYANSLSNDWVLNDTKPKRDQRFNLTFNGLVKNDKFKFGSVTGLNYTNTYQTLQIHRQFWDSTAQQLDYTDNQYTRISRVSANQNFAFYMGNHKLEFRNFFNQIGRSQATLRESNLITAPNEKSYAFLYDSRTTLSSQLSGSHSFFDGKTQYTWTGGYVFNKKDMPDYRRIRYNKQQTDPDSMYYAPIPSGTADPLVGGRFYSYLRESIRSFNHNLKQTVNILGYSFELNAGNYFEYKSRSFTARTLGYVIKPGIQAFYWKRLPIDKIFSPTYAGVPGGFQLDEITSLSDAYYAQNKLTASYIAGSFPIGKHIKLQGGMRYEANTQSLQSYLNTDSIHPSVKTKFFLPSFNGSYSFTDKHILRVAYSKTLNRPEFREWSPFYFYDFELNGGTYGSLFPTVLNSSGGVLRVCQITNYDLRYEFYPSVGEYIQVGAFYKTFIDPIQQVILTSGGSDSRAYTFINANSAIVQGVEIDVRKKLDFVDKWLNTKFFKDFSIVGNLSLMKSQMTITGIYNQNKNNPLQNQSPYIANGGLYYQNDSTGTQLSILYNSFGSRVSILGTGDFPNIGELTRQMVDITLIQKIYKAFSLTVGVQNLLDTPFRFYQDTNHDGKFKTNGTDKEMTRYYMGRYYSFGVRIVL